MTRYEKWEILSSKTPKNTNEVIDILLANRKITDKKTFFNPKHPTEFSPSELGIDAKEIEKALDLLKSAKEKNQKIMIYGDYDVDGVTSTAILWETLHNLGFNVMPYIPDRFEDGYGISIESIQKILDKNSDLSLFITVDNGIVAHEAIDFVREEGLDIIVTDHHQKDDKILNANAVVHTDKISGAGVSYLFSKQIAEYFESKFADYLDLLTLGTVADQMNLSGVNRSFVFHGLKSLQNSQRPGFSRLFFDSAIKNPDEISTYHINYLIAPRLNAAGRMASGLDALRLICTKDQRRAVKLSSSLNKLNFERQNAVSEALKKAEKISSKENIIVISDPEFHEGIIGLIASKLVEQFNRPAIVLSQGKEISKASARSIDGFSIIEAIRNHQDMLIKAGGHDMAAGFLINTEKISKFSKAINESSDIDTQLLVSKIKADLELDFSLINWDLIEKIDSFAPFGIGNRQPTFVSKNNKVLDFRKVGREGGHLKLKISDGEVDFDTIAFGFGDLADRISDSKSLDILYTPEKNIWNGNESIQLKIKDIKVNGK